MKQADHPTAMVSFPLTIVGGLFVLASAWLYLGPAQDAGFALVALGIGMALIGLAGINTRLAEVIHELRLIRTAAANRAQGEGGTP